MKNIFPEKMASIYSRLMILSLAGFGISTATMFDLTFNSWPVDTMPISSLLKSLFYVSMIFGILAVMSHWRMNIFILATLLVIVTLSIKTFPPFFDYLFISWYNTPSVTTTVKSIWDRNYNAGLGVVVIRSICIGDGENVVDIYNGTKIYEQDGTSGSKKQVGIEAIDVLQPGQVVNITFTRFKDDEFHDLLYQKFPHGFGV